MICHHNIGVLARFKIVILTTSVIVFNAARSRWEDVKAWHAQIYWKENCKGMYIHSPNQLIWCTQIRCVHASAIKLPIPCIHWSLYLVFLAKPIYPHGVRLVYLKEHLDLIVISYPREHHDDNQFRSHGNFRNWRVAYNSWKKK